MSLYNVVVMSKNILYACVGWEGRVRVFVWPWGGGVVFPELILIGRPLGTLIVLIFWGAVAVALLLALRGGVLV